MRCGAFCGPTLSDGAERCLSRADVPQTWLCREPDLHHSLCQVNFMFGSQRVENRLRCGTHRGPTLKMMLDGAYREPSFRNRCSVGNTVHIIF